MTKNLANNVHLQNYKKKKKKKNREAIFRGDFFGSLLNITPVDGLFSTLYPLKTFAVTYTTPCIMLHGLGSTQQPPTHFSIS